jgi:hypothetical protein
LDGGLEGVFRVGIRNFVPNLLLPPLVDALGGSEGRVTSYRKIFVLE